MFLLISKNEVSKQPLSCFIVNSQLRRLLLLKNCLPIMAIGINCKLDDIERQTIQIVSKNNAVVSHFLAKIDKECLSLILQLTLT